MDFSALNPNYSNPLNLAARNNQVALLLRLLYKYNPNLVDNRGWTCLHEAAAHSNVSCIHTILNHPSCRPLSETHEGHTALYVACANKSSVETITCLIQRIEDIIHYSSNEMVSPLHLVSSQGRVEVVQILIHYGAILESVDYDGDTPLHVAAYKKQTDAVHALLHAGASVDTKNNAGLTPLHLACLQGCLATVKAFEPFLIDVNQLSIFNDTPLGIAAQEGCIDLLNYLLEQGADPNIENTSGELALTYALNNRNSKVFRVLLPLTKVELLRKDIVFEACKPNLFHIEIISCLLESDLESEFFNQAVDFNEGFGDQLDMPSSTYKTNAPLNMFLSISKYFAIISEELCEQMLYLVLGKGLGVNPLHPEECPPLVFIHFCEKMPCFIQMFKILLEHGGNVDHFSSRRPDIPDAFVASLATRGVTLPYLLPRSLAVDPNVLLTVIRKWELVEKMDEEVKLYMLSFLEYEPGEALDFENYAKHVNSLRHLCRLRVRDVLRKKGITTSHGFLTTLELLPVPRIIRNYLKYTP